MRIGPYPLGKRGFSMDFLDMISVRNNCNKIHTNREKEVSAPIALVHGKSEDLIKKLCYLNGKQRLGVSIMINLHLIKIKQVSDG